MSVTIARTESGTAYEFSHDFMAVRRIPAAGASREMRRDAEWLRCTVPSPVTVGEPICILLVPLGKGNVTIRMTTPVVSIERHES